MSSKYDPSISSAAYLEIARKRSRIYKIPDIPMVKSILEYDRIDFGVDRSHVERLLDRASWDDALVRESRKPRVFLDALVNQRGNAEIRCLGGSQEILFKKDFASEYFTQATSAAYGAHRSLGELAWFRDYSTLCSAVVWNKCPVAKAILFGFKARLEELRRQLAAEVEVVGAMDIELSYARNNVSTVGFGFTIPYERLVELNKESRDSA
ncbi:hypothetical protein FJ938_12695 [Mesorhizobium sp. B2-4-14]|uniref:hypothetical protein n=1 Tax=Mesorhizobium sp. B2-4-14 TaxID=2589935 RepID=UPI00112C0E82|nr:hypothetical protein [Mesorhizobium sp. B2-4-14]TPL06865.1 hypothetical protein FJ938_12695 [Mesorhizobium sp. B2-4-14]